MASQSQPATKTPTPKRAYPMPHPYFSLCNQCVATRTHLRTTAVPQMSSKPAAVATSASQRPNSRRLDKSEKNVLVHLLQAPKLTNGDIAKIIDVDERTISRRRKQLRTLGHLSPERNVKGAEKLRPWHLEVQLYNITFSQFFFATIVYSRELTNKGSLN